MNAAIPEPRSGVSGIAPNTRTGRITALDGMRGVAVGLVLVSHFALAQGWETKGGYAGTAGDLGVTVFFVLSGWLITSILRRPVTRGTGLRAFYVRRVRRIFPALYAFLAVVGVLGLFGLVKVTWTQLLASASFTWNYAPIERTALLGHTWTLAVEQQFYLLWPLALLALGHRRGFAAAVVVTLLQPFLRVAVYLAVPALREQIGIMLPTRADSLLVGCALALLPVANPTLFRRLQERVRQTPCDAAAVVVLVASFAITGTVGNPYLLTVGWTINSFAVATIVLTIDSGADTVVHRILRNRALVGLGVISYSVYVWQQLFLSPQNPALLRSPLGVLAALAVGWVSYRFIETPFLRGGRAKNNPGPLERAKYTVTPPVATSVEP